MTVVGVCVYRRNVYIGKEGRYKRLIRKIICVLHLEHLKTFHLLCIVIIKVWNMHYFLHYSKEETKAQKELIINHIRFEHEEAGYSKPHIKYLTLPFWCSRSVFFFALYQVAFIYILSTVWMWLKPFVFSSPKFFFRQFNCSVVSNSLHPMDWGTPGFPVYH